MKQLEAEDRRLQRKLQRAETIIALPKKVAEILEIPLTPLATDVWVANYYSARNPLRLSSLVILGVVARMFRCATRSSCWCT